MEKLTTILKEDKDYENNFNVEIPKLEIESERQINQVVAVGVVSNPMFGYFSIYVSRTGTVITKSLFSSSQKTKDLPDFSPAPNVRFFAIYSFKKKKLINEFVKILW